MKISFATKLIIILVALTVTQGLLISYYSHRYATDMIINNKRSDMKDFVNRIDININDKVRYMSRQMESATSSYIFANFFSSRDKNIFSNTYFLEYFNHIASSFSAITNVFILDDTEVLYDRNGNMSGAALTDGMMAVYTMAAGKNGQAVWLGIREALSPTESDAPVQVISVACAVISAAGNVEGALVIELEPGNFSSLLLNNQNTFPNQYTFIVDKSKNIICSNKNIATQWAKLVADEFDRGNRSFQMVYDGRSYYICGQYNGLTSWESFSAIALSNIYAQTDTLKKITYTFMAVCTVMIAMVIIFTTYSMTVPIKELSTAMRMFREVDVARHIETKRRDEIGELVHSFNYMSDKIEKLINEVYREKLLQKNAEIKALQSQINPHFIYNSLDTINWMVLDLGGGEVSKVIVALGNLMKYTMDQHSSIVPLSEEIMYVKNYLFIQKSRLEDKLGFSIDIAADAELCFVPKLILQPIVENAIVHGVEPQKKAVSIEINAEVYGTELVVVITDDGKGMDEEKASGLLTAERDGAGGIGLKNVDRRIKLQYGEEYGLSVKSSPGCGTTVTVRLPYQQTLELKG